MRVFELPQPTQTLEASPPFSVLGGGQGADDLRPCPDTLWDHGAEFRAESAFSPVQPVPGKKYGDSGASQAVPEISVDCWDASVGRANLHRKSIVRRACIGASRCR